MMSPEVMRSMDELKRLLRELLREDPPDQVGKLETIFEPESEPVKWVYDPDDTSKGLMLNHTWINWHSKQDVAKKEKANKIHRTIDKAIFAARRDERDRTSESLAEAADCRTKAINTVRELAGDPDCKGSPGECDYNGACMYQCGKVPDTKRPPIGRAAWFEATGSEAER